MGKEKETQEKEELEALRKKVADLEEKLKKLEQIARNSNIRAAELQKELEYFKERYRRDLEEQRKYAPEAIAVDLLGVLDNFERAYTAASSTRDFDSLLKGIELILSDLKKILEKHGIREIELEGREFDPFLAEAVETKISPEHPPNTVIKVIQKGYVLHDRVIRPARVIVSVSGEEEEEIT
jgi:molecular chaperone GrpE